MTFLYLVPTGMNDPGRPEWGSWAGRYGPNEKFPGRPYFWANRQDAWDGGTSRDNTLARWAAALQNDFRARLDWCVKDRRAANHPPAVRVAGDPVSGRCGRWKWCSTPIGVERRRLATATGCGWMGRRPAGPTAGAIRLEGAGTATAHGLS
jgi:hypothetical protein